MKKVNIAYGRRFLEKSNTSETDAEAVKYVFALVAFVLETGHARWLPKPSFPLVNEESAPHGRFRFIRQTIADNFRFMSAFNNASRIRIYIDDWPSKTHETIQVMVEFIGRKGAVLFHMTGLVEERGVLCFAEDFNVSDFK
jgi:hypothetical protein